MPIYSSCRFAARLLLNARTRGLDPLYDNRDEPVGARFATMDLIGPP